MAYSSLPTVITGQPVRSSWGNLVDANLDDHETRIGDLETATAAASLAGLTDVALASPVSSGDVLTYNGAAWANDPPAAVDLATADVTGRLPLANLVQGTALSVLGVTGNATANEASIVAASDGQVLRRSGTSVGFGAVDLTSANAITGALPLANLPTNFAQTFTSTVNLTNAQIIALPTTPITLVSAPASGFLIWPSRILLMFKAGASSYTNINADGFLFVVINTSAPVGFLSSFLANESGSPGLTMLSDFLGTTGNKIHQLTWPWQDDRGAASSWGLLSDTDTLSTMVAASLEIKIDNNGAGILTGGTGGNVLRVVTEYSLVAAP